MERSLPNIPDEILFEIFRRLPKGKLIEISELCSKFRAVVNDTRLWKNVHIKYEPRHEVSIAFEELYPGPWSVKVIDLFGTQINPPVFSRPHQTVKVTKLELSFIRASKVTIEAILAKYQCTELCLNYNCADQMAEIAPEAFSKQTAFEALSLKSMKFGFGMNFRSSHNQYHLWLAQVLSNCKNLKRLDLSNNYFSADDILGLVKNLPVSLEKVSINPIHAEFFFELLTKRTPNLRELELCPRDIKCPSLLKFQFLETLYIRHIHQDISDLCMYIRKFPALKTVHVLVFTQNRPSEEILNRKFEKIRTLLEPHGLVVVRLEEEGPLPKLSKDGNLWEVSHAV